jgi:hypothetical protein
MKIPLRDLLSDLVELRGRADDLRDETRRLVEDRHRLLARARFPLDHPERKQDRERMISPIGGRYYSN